MKGLGKSEREVVCEEWVRWCEVRGGESGEKRPSSLSRGFGAGYPPRLMESPRLSRVPHGVCGWVLLGKRAAEKREKGLRLVSVLWPSTDMFRGGKVSTSQGKCKHYIIRTRSFSITAKGRRGVCSRLAIVFSDLTRCRPLLIACSQLPRRWISPAIST